MNERQSNSAAINQNEPQPNDVEGSHTNRNEDDENSLKGEINSQLNFLKSSLNNWFVNSLAELCHAKILQKCGSAVIEGFAEADLPLNQKCRIREVSRCVNLCNTISQH